MPREVDFDALPRVAQRWVRVARLVLVEYAAREEFWLRRTRWAQQKLAGFGAHAAQLEAAREELARGELQLQ